MRLIILLLIFLTLEWKSSYSQDYNNKCDSTTYLLVRQMPLYFGDYDGVINHISSRMTSDIKSFLKVQNINITMKILCYGKVEIISPNDNFKEFCRILEDELNKLKWIPGKNKEEFVSVESVLPVRIIDNKLKLYMPFANVKGKVMRCTIIDEDTKLPVSYVRLITKYNSYSYYSNDKGEVYFYCDANDEVEISHINYQTFNFSTTQNDTNYQLFRKQLIYEFETLDLTKYSPEKLPNKNLNCNYSDWEKGKEPSFVFIGLGNNYQSEMAVFNGGLGCLYNYLSEKFTLPDSAILNEYIDTAIVSFIVDEFGSIQDVKIDKKLDFGINKIITDLFYNMPKWKHGSQANEKVSQKFMIKLVIGYNKYWKKTMDNK